MAKIELPSSAMNGLIGSSESPSSTFRKKLTGRAFYMSLGSPKMILAPMVDQSEFAWRMLTRSYMKPDTSKQVLAYTPMFHARLFKETVKYREHHFQPTRMGQELPASELPEQQTTTYLDGNPSIDRPLFVQFCANDPNELLEAARCVEPYCDAVDLNLGCPQGIARKGHYGAFLQEDCDLIYRLINKLHQNLSIPVTAKMRILETKEKTLEYAKIILSAGASIITVHGRQREQKGHKTGLADWSVIRYLRESLPAETVIFANGNILRHQDIGACLEKTGADGVMSAEGNLCDPTIFYEGPPIGQEGREYWRGEDGKGGYRMDGVFRRYMDILYHYVLEKPPPLRQLLFVPSDMTSETKSEVLENSRSESEADDQPPKKKQKRDGNATRPSSPNLVSMQAHLFHLLRPLVSKHTNVRDALAKSKAGDMAAFENVLTLVEAATRVGLLDYEAHPESHVEEDTATDGTADGNAEDITDFESSVRAVKACKRPWWVCQPYIRPLPKEALEKGSLSLSKKELKKLAQDNSAPGMELPQSSTSEKERIDLNDGLEKAEIPKEAMVCG